MREWDNSVFVCDTCDNYLLWEQYDAEARMCKACAKVMEERHEQAHSQ